MEVGDRRGYNSGGFHVKDSDSACMYLKSLPITGENFIDELEDTNDKVSEWQENRYCYLQVDHSRFRLRIEATEVATERVVLARAS